MTGLPLYRITGARPGHNHPDISHKLLLFDSLTLIEQCLFRLYLPALVKFIGLLSELGSNGGPALWRTEELGGLV